MKRLQHSVVHRLPQHYRWLSESHHTVVRCDDMDQSDDDGQRLIALHLLSHDNLAAWEILVLLQETLAAIQIESQIAECEEYPCLFIRCEDESATNCCLKNKGVAITETFTIC